MGYYNFLDILPTRLSGGRDPGWSSSTVIKFKNLNFDILSYRK